jgi:hypothetical protein
MQNYGLAQIKYHKLLMTQMHTIEDTSYFLPYKFEGHNADPDLSKKLTTEEELSGIFNVLMTALRRIVHNKRIFVNEKTIQERREKYEMSTDPIDSLVKKAVAEDSIASDQTTKDHFYQALVNYCKKRNLVVPSKENVGKILKKKYGYQEGREASGERRTFWKGVRLVDTDRENDKDDHIHHSVLPQPLRQFN